MASRWREKEELEKTINNIQINRERPYNSCLKRK
jgi:hypothetical protein